LRNRARRLLRNSTIFASQKLGLGQCSQKAPAAPDSAKQGLIVSTGLTHGSDLISVNLLAETSLLSD
jgi:hypothetical protein